MSKKLSINEKLTKYFLENSRITLMAFICLIIFGLVSFFTLKITGFPNPDINIVVINTVYPGASAQTVEDRITKPIESAIKNVDGVESYNSSTSNSFSNTTITLATGTNYDTASTQIDSAIKSIQLPDGVESPRLIKPNISIDDFIFSLASKNGDVNLNETYTLLSEIRSDIQRNPEVKSVNISGDLEQKVIITLDQSKLTRFGLTSNDVINQLRTWNFSIPITQNEQVEGRVQNITLSISGSSLQELKNLAIISSTKPGAPIRLEELGNIEIQAISTSAAQPYVGIRDGDVAKTLQSQLFSIDVIPGADVTAFERNTLDKILNKYFELDSEEAKDLSSELRTIAEKYQLVTIYDSAEENQAQADEVFGGLVGEKLNIPGVPDWVGYIGFLLGGIQLVFLMMLALVSWRAAIVAALAIPLSFFFSLIAVKLTGNDLNTLVLFSLVLVIGLVVDPALVLLEAIQRQIDNGLKGGDAVLAAVRETGSGLFLAVLTSMIVFIPFGVVSGIFGQIISYIPLTVIPALIASYIVPLIILAWISTKVLKRNPNAKDEEEENLWPAARWMIKYTRWILTPKPLYVALRVFIILLSLLIPIGIAGAYIGSGTIKTVQFAQPQDSTRLSLGITNFPQQTPEKYSEINKIVVETIIQDKNVKDIASLSAIDARSNTYFIALKERGDRDGQKLADAIASELDKKVNDALGDKVFNADVSVLGAGPQSGSFPIALSVKTENTQTKRDVALELTAILNKVCEKGQNAFELKSDCEEGKKAITKVDNGYEGTETKFVEILIRRERTLVYPVNPIEVRTIIASLYKTNEGNSVGTFQNNGQDLEMILESTIAGPNSIDEIKNIPIRTIDGRPIKLSDIADIQEVETLASLRRVNGESVGVVTAKTQDKFSGQQAVGQIQQIVIDEYNKNLKEKFGKDTEVGVFSEGSSASFSRSFTELFIALALAVVLTYIVLVIFFNSFLQPLVILFAIPLTFIGIFPALALFAGGQLGFLEIIGIIILVGIVENVAIFLIDSANQHLRDGMGEREAIAVAAGIRFRPIMLTKLTTLVSTLPLAILSDFYRSLSVVIIFGLLTSGIVSLFTSPILYIFFRWVSKKFRGAPWWGKVLYLVTLFAPFIALAIALAPIPFAQVFAIAMSLVFPIVFISIYSVDYIKWKKDESL